MNVKLRIRKHGATLFANTYDITDPESFGHACADAWYRFRMARHERAANVGELMDMQKMNILDDMEGAEISIVKP